MRSIGFVLGLGILVSCATAVRSDAEGAAESGADLRIDVRRGRGPSLVEIGITVSAAEDVSLYSWQGAIYPMLGRGLSVEVWGETGRSYRVEAVGVALPKFPHEDDLVVAREYTYPKPLIVRLMDQSGDPVTGCVHLTVVYDTRGDAFAGSRFSILHLQSKPARICSD